MGKTNEDAQELHELEVIADADVERYSRNRPKKWFVFFFGILIGGFLGFGLPKLVTMLSSAKYYRTFLDATALKYF